MTTDFDENTICCPKFDPTLWDDKIFEWENKKFIKDSVFTIFNIPINFGKVIKRLDMKVKKSGGLMLDWICLSDHTSIWNMDIYLAVDKEIENAENTTITGKFYSKVYEGPFQNTGKWCKEFATEAKTKGFSIKKLLMWYTTCPKCAKKYGKNYVVIMSQVE